MALSLLGNFQIRGNIFLSWKRGNRSRTARLWITVVLIIIADYRAQLHMGTQGFSEPTNLMPPQDVMVP